jgi:hypothetical protein
MLGFEEIEPGLMRRTGDTDDRASIVRRYIEGGPPNVHPAGAGQAVEDAVVDGWDVGAGPVAGQPADDAAGVAGEQTGAGAVPLEPRLSGAAAGIAAMTGEAYDNLGLTPLFDANPSERLTFRRWRQLQPQRLARREASTEAGEQLN